MWLWIFLLGISTLTLFHSHALMGAAGLVVIALSIIFQTQKQFRKTSKKIILYSTLWILAWGSVSFTHRKYFSKNDFLPQEAFLQTGLILDHVRADRYLIKDKEGKLFFLNIEKNLELGDLIFVSGKMSPGLANSPLGKKQPESGALSWQGYKFQYPYRLLMRGIYGDIYAENSILIDINQGDFITKLRNNINQSIENVFEEQKSQALIGGMVLGETGKFSENYYKQFIESGLVHLVAVSGGNMIFVMILLSILLFWVPFYFRISFIGVGLICYALLCGGDSSVLRALIMSLLGLVALFGGRTIHFRRSLQLTIFILLMMNPYFLWYDIGFIFSLGAVIGLKILSPYLQIQTTKKTKNLMIFATIYNRYIIPSLAATIGVFPFILLFTQQINVLSILTNILVTPLVPIIMVSSLAMLIFPIPFIINIINDIINTIFYLSQITSIFGVYIVVNSQLVGLGFVLIRIVIMIRLSSNPSITDQEIDDKKSGK